MLGFEFDNYRFTIDEIRSKTNPYISQIEAIFYEAFPPSETIPFITILKKMEDYREIVYYCRKENEIVAIALMAIFEEPSFLLLDYFALKNEFRGKGIGTVFLSKLIQFSEENGPYSLIIAEVEDPEFGEDQQVKNRRIRFYQNIGMKILSNVTYILPPLNEKEVTHDYLINSDLFTHLKLLLFSPKKMNDFSPALIKSIIIALYESHYKLKNYDDLLKLLVDNIPKTPQLL